MKPEESLAHNRPRALIEMATGSGKTYTAASFYYRLIMFARARRILFLVDRKNLGAQALNEFQQYVSPYTNAKFTEEYVVQHLRRNTVEQACKVCFTTIQRLYSILQGEEDYGEANEESSLFELENRLIKEPAPLAYNPKLPIEAFDFIVIDECHRSIYNYWRQVLEYFDALLIGLTATKTPQAVAFFKQNVVQDYYHEKAVVDGVNVGYSVYRIETKIANDGATLARQPGMSVPHRDRRTKRVRNQQLDEQTAGAIVELFADVFAELDADLAATRQMRPASLSVCSMRMRGRSSESFLRPPPRLVGLSLLGGSSIRACSIGICSEMALTPAAGASSGMSQGWFGLKRSAFGP
jgi:type I restriction enzyme, R subunit